MPRYVAFLRGVSPVNTKNVELRRSFEEAGFSDVKTMLSSGNVAFSAPAKSQTALARQAEAAMAEHLGRTFYMVVRPQRVLRSLVEADPFAEFDLPVNAKRIVTFLGEPPATHPSLPIEAVDVSILAMVGGDVLSVYTPSPRGSKLMALVEKTFGSNVTTRTWETVIKCANG